MDILVDILEEILENVFELLITSRRIPKPIRYFLVAVVTGFVIAIGLLLVFQGGMAGSLLGVGLIALGIGAGSFLAVRIHRN